MAIEKPSIALGLEIPNPTFSIPGESPLDAAGWTISASVTRRGEYSDIPSDGHSRVQYYVNSGPGTHTIDSAPSPALKGVQVASTKYCAFVWYKRGAEAAVTMNVQIGFFSSTGALIGTWQTIGALGSETAWTSKILGPATIIPESDSFTTKLRITWTTSGATYAGLLIAFACAGIWNGATDAYKELADYLQAGTHGVLLADEDSVTDLMGRQQFADFNRYAIPCRAELVFDWITKTDADLWRRAYTFGRGRAFDASSVQNPAGGRYHTLLRPGVPTMPAVGLYRWADEQFPLRPANPYLADPSEYSGTAVLIERV